ncbi:hypothetical protein LQM11_004790 [Vibrio parahaemolyticus]|nr:hypothetical protein [Vibrio parahaemolyticus]
MSPLHIVYGYCKNRHKSTLFEYLVQTTSILKIKTIGHIADNAVFAALTYSLTPPCMKNIHWLQSSIPNKKKATHTEMVERPALSRKECRKLELTNEQTQHYQRVRRAYRKQHNLVLTESNWRQHINRKEALSETEKGLRHLTKHSTTFFLARGQQLAPHSTSY